MFLDYKNKLDKDYRNANGIDEDTPISVRKIRDWCSKQEKNLIIYSGIVESFLDKSDSIVEFDKGFYDSISFNLKKLGYHIGVYSPYFENNINKDILSISNVFIKDPLVSTVKSWKDIDIEENKRIIFGVYGKNEDFNISEKLRKIDRIISMLEKSKKIDVDVFRYKEEDSSYVVAQAKVKQKKRF